MTTLQTFRLPNTVHGTESDICLAQDLMRAWQTDGIFQVATDPAQNRVTADAMEASRRFFGLPLDVKARHVSDLTYSGYIASGEEVTAGEADYSEIFTVCKDVPVDDPRLHRRWPCHGVRFNETQHGTPPGTARPAPDHLRPDKNGQPRRRSTHPACRKRQV